MTNDWPRIVMIGPFPPPVHGMASVNAAVREQLQAVGGEPFVIDLSASSLDRSLVARLDRLPRVVRGLHRLARVGGLRGSALYMSVSGGLGQVYELLYLLVARRRGMRIFLHHHSFAYLDIPNRLTKSLVKVAGPNAVHIVQSLGLAKRLQLSYRAPHVIPVSNAVFFLPVGGAKRTHTRKILKVLGFLSNISQEKGVFDYLDLMAEIQARGLPLRGKLAGPFMDARMERLVRERLCNLYFVDYVGPKFGQEKDAFYDGIDAFVFPTRYVNETEGLVVHESMMCGLPVIAYGRGAIPEIVGQNCGLVVPTNEPFVPAALEQIESWLSDTSSFQTASSAAADQFKRTRESSTLRWEKLLHAILGNMDALAALASQSPGSA